MHAEKTAVPCFPPVCLLPGAEPLVLSFAGAVRLAQCNKCVVCKEKGATAKCSHNGCKSYFHLHCTQTCKVVGGWVGGWAGGRAGDSCMKLYSQMLGWLQ
jgi:hypothetical protein